MQINQNTNLSFQAIHAQTTKMTPIQKKLTDKITRFISYSDSYANATYKDIDICLFPAGVDKIKAIFLNSKSENFVKNTKNKIVSVTSNAKENSMLTADRILNKLDEILAGKYKLDEYDYSKINSKKTDKAMLFKTLKDDEIDAPDYIINAYR